MKRLLFPILLLFISFVYSCKKDNDQPKHPPVVTTEKSITDSIRSSEIGNGADTIKLSGSATDKDGKVVAYLWSLISGPNTPQIATPGSQETFVTFLTPGTYVFQLMATDNDGFTGTATDTVRIILKQPTIVVLKNPSTTANEMLIAGNSTDNYSDGGSPEIDAYNWTQYGLIDLGKGAFKFDLSAIPTSVVIKSAKLTLYSNPTPQNGNHVDANYGPNNAMFIERITSPWNNLTTTWQTQPSTDTNDHISIPQSNQSREDLIDVDVTSLVQKMISGVNYGFEIRLQGTDMYNSRIFCGSRYSDATKHPLLTVTY